MVVRIIERCATLCSRRLMDWRARFLALAILAKVKLLKTDGVEKPEFGLLKGANCPDTLPACQLCPAGKR
jgi:hypothetical protein